ncbi:hypothetical protein [Rossellomorea aquimaris]|uniref:Uncharacterized protein n=1 Tax=Rossellomorea aquimaris TaxID=189382 RepID=A0A5D4TXN9_9BACI|nr:hypothetical protein [Rossellomorea aquimaris]TYS79771.1 hypothetical protein FZC80_09000 [Rossellomorea aquimaris]
MKLLLRITILLVFTIGSFYYLSHHRIEEKKMEGVRVTDKIHSSYEGEYYIEIKSEEEKTLITLRVKSEEIWELIRVGERYDVEYAWYGNEKAYVKSITYTKP